MADVGPPLTDPRSSTASVRMIVLEVEGCDRKFTEFVARTISPYPNEPQLPGVAVIVGMEVVLGVRDGVRVRVTVAELAGVRVTVAVGATPTRAKYVAATHPSPPVVSSFHHV